MKKEKVSKKETVKENKKITTNKKQVTKRENVFKKIGKYFKGVFKEGKRIRWTTGKELLKYSIATVIFVIFFGAYFYAIDWIALIVRSLAK